MSERKPEDEYFAREEQRVKAKLKAKLDADQAAKAVEERRVLHHHRCGKCGEAMDTHEFRGLDIEICPSCGAVLLDKGELETLAGEAHTGALTSLLQLFGRDAD